MNCSISPIKEKQMYCSKLLNKEPIVYETYKRMVKSQKNSYSNLNTQPCTERMSNPGDTFSVTKNTKSKEYLMNMTNPNYKTQNILVNPHVSYLKYLKKNGYGFPFENRFKWQNLANGSYPTGTNTFPRHTKLVRYKNKFHEIERKKKCEPTAYSNKSLERTKRVINSEMNEKDEDYINKKHKKYPNLNKFVNVGKCGMKSFIKKTPLDYNYKGIRIVKRSHSFDLNLFMKNYALFQLPKNRKHYPGKDSVKEIFGFNRCNSWDSFKLKEKKACRKFQKKMHINPINWHVNIYNNFYGKF